MCVQRARPQTVAVTARLYGLGFHLVGKTSYQLAEWAGVVVHIKGLGGLGARQRYGLDSRRRRRGCCFRQTHIHQLRRCLRKGDTATQQGGGKSDLKWLLQHFPDRPLKKTSVEHRQHFIGCGLIQARLLWYRPQWVRRYLPTQGPLQSFPDRHAIRHWIAPSIEARCRWAAEARASSCRKRTNWIGWNSPNSGGSPRTHGS
jgi:hypothetical protein